MIFCGIGARRQARAEDIAALVRRAFAEARRDVSELALIAGVDKQETLPAVSAAAALLGVSARSFDRAQLAVYAGGCVTHSARVMAALGVPSVAEAAALAAAGPGGRLVLARIASGEATAALAESEARTS